MTVQVLQRLKSADEMPGSFGRGESKELFADDELFYWRRFERYGPIFKSCIKGHKFAYLIGPEANRLVLSEQVDHFSTRLGWQFLEPLLGRGILMQGGAEHRATRKLMFPSMHGRAIANYFDTVQQVVDQLLIEWGQQDTVPLIDSFGQFTTIVASKLFLGTESDAEIQQTSQWFRQLMRGLRGKLKLDIPQTLYGQSQQARRNLLGFVRNKITTRRAQGNLQECRDVLGMLMVATDEQGNHLTESEVTDQALMLLLAGQDNPAMLLSWVLFELSAHPEWRDRLRTELAQVVGDAPLQLSHLNKLPQMSNVLKEAERLYPPVFGMARGVIKDVEFAGYHIPAGWYIDISPMLTHRLPDLYPNPDRFDPDRFAPPREEDKRHPFALIGFGGGPHTCIGLELAKLEMKVFLATLLRQFDWTVTPDRAAIAPVLQPTKVQEHLQAELKRR
ncbi:cytochrome P450 [Stenomitos frigidus]|uniref:Cytochrome P450 n=1 Tax=Stenomitos frigidus ULC18 TaxID=2107698 RepID=A0A2T1DY74_9CYAN|nr:cytochrome P450 [Stenomitos frigidus]PSB25430.1 cytochrome P450 [Stenomitos frigidus ULC18]